MAASVRVSRYEVSRLNSGRDEFAFHHRERFTRGLDCAVSNVMARKQKGPEIALQAFGILE